MAGGESILEPSVAAKVIAEFTWGFEPGPGSADGAVGRTAVRARAGNPGPHRQGGSNKEIASQLFIAEGTVKNHVTHILGKRLLIEAKLG